MSPGQVIPGRPPLYQETIIPPSAELVFASPDAYGNWSWHPFTSPGKPGESLWIENAAAGGIVFNPGYDQFSQLWVNIGDGTLPTTTSQVGARGPWSGWDASSGVTGASFGISPGYWLYPNFVQDVTVGQVPGISGNPDFPGTLVLWIIAGGFVQYSVLGVNGWTDGQYVVWNPWLGVYLQSTPTIGSPVSLTVAAFAGNGLDASYDGTVHFTSSDGAAALPADYTFTAADGGSHSFDVTFATAGTQTITATDTATGSITGTASASL